VLVAIFPLLVAKAWAQDFPEGPIKFMNPFHPGEMWTSKAEFKTAMESAGFVPQVMGIAESHKYLESEVPLLNKLIHDFDLLPAKK
jgi:tripartite-type tricarboxylate transporter receptor subunit TctC